MFVLSTKGAVCLGQSTIIMKYNLSTYRKQSKHDKVKGSFVIIARCSFCTVSKYPIGTHWRLPWCMVKYSYHEYSFLPRQLCNNRSTSAMRQPLTKVVRWASALPAGYHQLPCIRWGWGLIGSRTTALTKISFKYHSIQLNGIWMVLGVLWPRVFEWYLNGFLYDIFYSLYRSVVLNGIMKYRWEYH